MKKQSKKAPKIAPTTLKQAFTAWMGGVGRGELVKKFDLGITYGALGRAFRALNPDKKWSDLKKQHDQKSKGRKSATKEGVRRAA